MGTQQPRSCSRRGCCDRSPAQYERNRRSGHLVQVVARPCSATTLPSVGLRLNASKSESRLVTMQRQVAGPERVLGEVSRVQLDVCLFARGAASTVSTARRAPGQTAGVRLLLWLEFCVTRTLGKHDSFAPEPPVDDLSTSRGVVLSRAATILRSIETHPLAGGSTGGRGRERRHGYLVIFLVAGRAKKNFARGKRILSRAFFPYGGESTFLAALPSPKQ